MLLFVFALDSRGAESEEKHEPASDIDTEVVDSLKALDPDRPIREADMLANGMQAIIGRVGGRPFARFWTD